MAMTRHRGDPSDPDSILSIRDAVILALTAVVAAGATRLIVLPVSVIDWDESAYLLVSRDILHGRLPYEGVFDHKPVALYYIFALAQLLFGEGVHAIRLLAAIASAATAYLLSLFLMRATSAGILASAMVGVIYALSSTINGGLATNTEILMNLYLAGVLVLANTGHIAERFVPGRSVAIGVLLGLMMHTNYLSGFIILGFCAAYALSLGSALGLAPALRIYLQNGAVIFSGFLGITTILLMPIVVWSDLGAYFGKQIAFLSGYHRDPGATLFSIALVGYAHLLTLAAVLAVFLVRSTFRTTPWPSRNRAIAWQLLVYLGFGFIAGTASGRLYPHYFILLLPSLSIISGLFLTFPMITKHQHYRAAGLILVSVVFLWSNKAYYEMGLAGYMGRAPDLPAEIAQDLKPRLDPEDTIYVYDYQPVLYYLLAVRVPTNYPFSFHHLSPAFAVQLDFRPAAEMARIVSQAPRFVIAGSDPAGGRHGDALQLLRDTLSQHYRLVKIYNKGAEAVRVYERFGSGRSRFPNPAPIQSKKREDHSGGVLDSRPQIRWLHPEYGMVPPVVFIPIAEEGGQSMEIGACVVRTACAQHLAWREAELPPIPAEAFADWYRARTKGAKGAATSVA